MNRNLNLLLGGQLISQIGDKFHMLAIAFMVLKTTGSPAKMGIVLFCSIFPSMLLGFISGAFLDRYSRKTIIVGADVARGLIVSGLCFLYYFNALSFTVLLAAQLMLSVCTRCPADAFGMHGLFRSGHSSDHSANCQTRAIDTGQFTNPVRQRYIDDYRTAAGGSHGGLGRILDCFHHQCRIVSFFGRIRMLYPNTSQGSKGLRKNETHR
jgi:hypothetical protein